MSSSFFFYFIYFLIMFMQICCNESQMESETTTPANENPRKDGYVDMEIISLEVLPGVGNAIALSWGKPLREYNLNWTYGVYYGLTEDEALKEPKVETQDLCVEVWNLTFCQRYIFAVRVIDSNNEIAHPPQNIRLIGTLIDPQSAPENLQLEFIPDEQPCLLIKWSASCPNIAIPLGYTVTVSEKKSSHVMLLTVPKTTSVDISQSLRVTYGKSYDIKVSTEIIGSNSTAIVSYKVPHFLQPYKVRLTSKPDGTFMMYWREPYVPYYVGSYYYEIYIYPGITLDNKYEIFSSNKPIFIYKGNLTEYTFLVGLRSEDGLYKSRLTTPLVKSLYGGEAYELSLN